jgi:GR25 family glycosyltransferase involved in LPS biosynthesis
MVLDFFDEIVVISLEDRVDRRMFMQQQMEKYGLPYRIFNAIRHPLGVNGLVESMKAVFKECVGKRNLNTLILEDDATFVVDPVAFLKEAIPQLPKPYDLFFLGLNLLTRPRRISANILKVEDSYSTHAICYSYEGMKFMMERLDEVAVAPYDQIVRTQILCRGRSFCTYPLLATQRPGYSDIENKEIDWGKLMSMTYNIHTKNIHHGY